MKKFVALLMTLTAAFLLAISASAEEYPTGTSGEAAWTLKGDTMYITGQERESAAVEELPADKLEETVSGGENPLKEPENQQDTSGEEEEMPSLGVTPILLGGMCAVFSYLVASFLYGKGKLKR